LEFMHFNALWIKFFLSFLILYTTFLSLCHPREIFLDLDIEIYAF